MLTSLGFMLIGYDNGLMGGLGKGSLAAAAGVKLCLTRPVNSPAFNATFGSPKPRMVGLIVAIFESGCSVGCIP